MILGISPHLFFLIVAVITFIIAFLTDESRYSVLEFISWLALTICKVAIFIQCCVWFAGCCKFVWRLA